MKLPLLTRFADCVSGLLLCVLVSLVGCVSTATVRPPSVPAARAGFERAGPEASPVYTFEGGPIGAPRLVLVHGLGDQGMRDFWPVVPALTSRFRVLALDLPGYGQSPPPARAYTPDDYVHTIHDLVARRTSEKVLVVGHSMGGAIALLYASKYHDGVERLALLDVAGVLYFREYARTVVGEKLAPRGDGLDFLRRFANALFRLGIKPMSGTDLADLPVKETPTLKFINHDFGHALQTVRVPVWLGWGKHDRTAPMRTMHALAFSLRPTKTVVYEHSGHVPMTTEPALVARDLLAFFASAPKEPLSTQEHVAEESLPDYSCAGKRDQVIVGRYGRIELNDCHDIKLHNVQARSLHLTRSSAVLRHVELTDGEVGVAATRSEVNWTGGRIRSHVCIDTSRSRLNLAGVHCDHRAPRGIVVRGRSHLVASVSGLAQEGRRSPLHGEFTLARD